MNKPAGSASPGKVPSGGALSAESLIRKLESHLAEARRTAQALGEMRDPAAIKPLVALAKQSGALRAAVIAALRKIAAGDELAATELAIALMEESGEAVTGRESGVHELSPADRRRSPRVLLEIPVVLKWQDESGHWWSENSTTKVVNAYGALVLLKSPVRVGQELEVTNLATRARTTAKVVCLSSLTAEGQEVGIELASSDPEFWVGRNP